MENSQVQRPGAGEASRARVTCPTCSGAGAIDRECTACGGTGIEPGRLRHPCNTCWSITTDSPPRGGGWELVECPMCDGAGKIEAGR